VIIRPDGTRQLLITQPDHAVLAERMMREWRADGLPDSPRRDVILLAIERHDHGWASLDAAPLVDDESESACGPSEARSRRARSAWGWGPKRAEKKIVDFIGAPDDVKQRVWPEAVARLDATSYAAALVAEHAVHIYRRHRTDPNWLAFFDEMEALRDRHLLRARPLQMDDLKRDYAFLRIGDLMSLTFCNGWTDVQKDDFGSTYSFRLEGTRLMVTPDPFEGREIPFEISARALTQSGFKSSSEAQAVVAAAPTVVLQGVVAGA
jgi:hypothetical protein